ncbi:MAG: DUF1059 domain-containing protein [Candidatus Falkowbacteria bacterium]
MMSITCASIGMDCDFTATGETEEDVISILSKHGQEAHAEAMKDVDQEEMVSMMRAKIVEE